MSKRNGSTNARKMVEVHAGDFWEPETAGQKFSGVIALQHLGKTKFGMKPMLDLANEATGECITVITSNLLMRKLNQLPMGTFVELEYKGSEKQLIGRKKVDVRQYAVKHEVVKLVDDWTGGKFYKKGKGNASTKAGKKSAKS